MNSALETIWQQIEKAANDHHIGGGVAIVQHRGEVVLRKSTGWAVREPEEERTPMQIDTIFDLASLTKVVATTPAILQLVSEGRINLDDSLATYIPEFGDEGAKHDITIRNLMTHSSGLLSWRGVYTQATGIDAYISSLAVDQPEVAPNSRVAYSCLGFILLGEVIRRVSGERIDHYSARHIFEPLGMSTTMYNPPAELLDRIAATELGNEYEVITAGADPLQGWRDYLVRGEVHDGNAWYGLEGISGNAGLFGTADDLLRYANMWANGGELDDVRILPEQIVHDAIQEHTGLSTPNQRRGLGWQMTPHADDLASVAISSASGMSDQAYGHTGFTGTALWIDPERDLISIVLTNRVHPKVTDHWGRIRAEISRNLANAFPVKQYI